MSPHSDGDDNHASADLATNGEFAACAVQPVEFVDGRAIAGDVSIHLFWCGDEVLWRLSAAECVHAAGSLTALTSAERASAAATLALAADWLRQNTA